VSARVAIAWLLASMAMGLAGCGRADRVAPPAAVVATTTAPAAGLVSEDATTAAPGADAVAIDVGCESDADCAVKDIGSCCGAFPRCVNKDSPTDPAGVQARCAELGRSGVCGFQEVAGCQCQAHECVNVPASPPEPGP